MEERIFITGITGTIGSVLAEKLIKRGVTVGGLTRQEKLLSKFSNMYLGDITNRKIFKPMLEDFRPTKIIHAAALKHVDLGESYQELFYNVNVVGSLNLMECIKGSRIELTLLSTDKAVFPINFYGLTKAMAENIYLKNGYQVIRYGNVLGSSGSFIPKLIQKLKDNTIIPITDIEMTRFWIRQEVIANYIIDMVLGEEKHGLNIPVAYIRSCSLMDLVRTLSNLLGTNPVIDYVGMRPGEKVHEHLFHDQEDVNGEKAFKTITSAYSNMTMDKRELRKLCDDLLNRF